MSAGRWKVVVLRRPLTTSRHYVYDWQAHAGNLSAFGTCASRGRALRKARRCLRELEREARRGESR